MRRRALLLALAGCADPEPGVWVDVDAGRAAIAVATDGRGSILDPDGRTIPEGDGWAEIRTDGELACTLDTGGRPDCWSLRRGTVDATVPAGPFTAYDVSADTALLVYEDGSARHWPDEVAPLPDGYTWQAVAAGISTEPWSCGVTTSGELRCEGVEDAAPDGPYTDVARDGAVVCALDDAGSAQCFEVADGAWTFLDTLDGPLDDFDYGTGAVCGIGPDAAIACAAIATDAEPTADALTITDGAPTSGAWVAVSVSEVAAFGCAVDTAGERTCWGNTPAQEWAE